MVLHTAFYTISLKMMCLRIYSTIDVFSMFLKERDVIVYSLPML